MKQSIKLNDEIKIDLLKLISGKMLLQAGSGGGKSYGIRRILEQSFGSIPHIVLDTEGEFASLREKYDYILIGKGYDIAADPKTAKLMALRLWERRASAIIDLYELDPKDRQLFVENFVDAMINAPKNLWKPVLLVIDEAHEYAPETEKSEYGLAMHRLASKGRKRHIAAVFATQSIASLSKRIVAACKNKLIGYASETNDVKRAAFELGFTPQEGLVLRDLDPGEFYAFGPAISKKIVKLKIGPVQTTHEESATKVFKAPPPSEKVKKELAALADLPEAAQEEANTIAALRKEIVELKRRPKQDPADLKKISDKAYSLGVSAAELQSRTREKEWEKKLAEANKELSKMGTALATINRISRQSETPVLSGPDKIEITPIVDPVVRHPLNQPAKEFKIQEAPPDGLPQGELAVLTALGQYRDEGLPRESITVLTTYKRSTRDAYIARLQTKGYVRAALGKIFITPEGMDVLGPNFEPLPTGQALRDKLMQILPKGEKEVLNVVLGEALEGFRGFVSRDHITNETTFKRSTRDAYIARLASRQLVETSAEGVRPVAKLLE